jgi:Cyclin, N-terminal domain
VAYAWVLFEKLIYKGIVKKHNRKLVTVLCLLIAFKCTEAYGGFKANEQRFLKLMSDFKAFIGVETHHHHRKGNDRYLNKPLIVYELKLLSALNFQTTVPLRYILPHMEAIMTVLDTNL